MMRPEDIEKLVLAAKMIERIALHNYGDVSLALKLLGTVAQIQGIVGQQVWREHHAT